VTDCRGQSDTATASLTFEQSIVANADSFAYTASPLVIDAASGLLRNDVNPASCAAIPPTFSMETPPTKGTVLVGVFLWLYAAQVATRCLLARHVNYPCALSVLCCSEICSLRTARDIPHIQRQRSACAHTNCNVCCLSPAPCSWPTLGEASRTRRHQHHLPQTVSDTR
jgi:hypothetical protein